jgi:kynurenine formamidase
MKAANPQLDEMLGAFAGSRIIDLEQMRHRGMPNHPNNSPDYFYSLHRRHEENWADARTPAGGMIVSTDHAGTHMDALCHNSEKLFLFGGKRVTSEIQTQSGFTYMGAETIAPFFGRGVLLDIGAHRGVERLEPNMTISRPELQEVEEAQGTPVRQGDVVLVRTGYGSLWGDPAAYAEAAGMGVDVSNWLAEKKVRAVGADNASWDVGGSYDKDMCCSLPGHVVLLARNGIYIIEHLYLEELSKTGHREFLLVYLPLKLKGATGSPLRPVAIVPKPD